MKRQKLIFGAIVVISLAIIVTAGYLIDQFKKEILPLASADYRACQTDDDCTATYFPAFACCQECNIFAINKINVGQQEIWRKKNCDRQKIICPEYQCLWPTNNVQCKNNQCQIVP